jgi:hypothetical protein
MEQITADKFRFIGMIQHFGLKRFVWSPQFVLAAVLTSAGTVLYLRGEESVSVHVGVAGDFLTIAATLFGVALAGFAIISTLLDERFARLLDRSKTSAYNLLAHFVVEGGILVGSIAATVAYRAFALALFRIDPVWEQVALGVSAFLFFWGLFGAVQLMRLVMTVAVVNSSLFSQNQQDPPSMQKAG